MDLDRLDRRIQRAQIRRKAAGLLLVERIDYIIQVFWKIADELGRFLTADLFIAR